MLEWLKKNWLVTVILLGIGSMLFIGYGCESKVPSLNSNSKLVTRAELQIELESILKTAEQRMIELDKQDAIRDLILQNALILLEGNPLSPVGILTAVFAIYGVGTGSQRIIKRLKDTGEKIGTAAG